jgi:RHS repeat-associated protein
LTGAVEDPGTSYTYAYDLAGNRTEVWENGVQTQSQSYNAANQVIGWSDDAAGNLLSDGTHIYEYDALSRQVSRDGATYAYNGDGVLVQAGATAYTLDLAAPLSQVLHDGTSSYIYGNDAERLRAVGGAWYIPDALGSVRATLDDSGAVLASTNYDPWGLPQASAIAPFGFTGEVQDAAGMVYLRARWYDAGSGRFGVRDPFAGVSEVPNTLHPYMYAANDPLRFHDPSGRCYGALEGLRQIPWEAEWCRNLDKAVLIYTSPNTAVPHATAWQKTQAYTYAVSWYTGHAVAVASVATAGMAGAGWVMTQGSAWLAAHQTAATVVVGGAIVASAADDVALLATTLTGTPEEQAAAYQAYQLGLADGHLPFADVAACASIITRRGMPDATFLMPQGVRQRNLPTQGDWIGRTFHPNDPRLRAKYPHGVPFTVQGYPDFTRYARVQVRIKMTGNRPVDFAAANQAAGFGKTAQDTPPGYVWHHHHDRTTMQLIPTDLHRGVRHTGGVGVIREQGTLP